MTQAYDIVVVGAGHAGCEAAAAAARLGRRVALVTLRRDRVDALRCARTADSRGQEKQDAGNESQSAWGAHQSQSQW